MPSYLSTLSALAGLTQQLVQHRGKGQVNEFPKARTVFVSSLIPGSSDLDPKTTLLLKDRKVAALIRDRLAAKLNLSDGPKVLVLDLAGITFTPLDPARIDPAPRPANSWRRVWNGLPRHQHDRRRGK